MNDLLKREPFPSHYAVYRVSNETVLLSSLRVFAKACELASSDPDWLAETWTKLHDALRHAEVIALSGTSGIGVLKPVPAGKRKHPDEAHPDDFTNRLLSDDELYERTHDPAWMAGTAGACAAPRNPDTDRAYQNTKHHRDELTHYKPRKGWSMLLDGLGTNFRLLLARFRFLLFDAGTARIFEPAPDEFRAALEAAEAAVAKLEAGLAVSPGPYHPMMEPASPDLVEFLRRQGYLDEDEHAEAPS